MVVVAAQELLLTASWGVKTRLYLGAGLSMVDLASDIAMVVTYTNEGHVGTAISLLVMRIVLSGTKPGVDTMRVASGAEQNEHNLID